jgi:hypothetical protein
MPGWHVAFRLRCKKGRRKRGKNAHPGMTEARYSLRSRGTKRNGLANSSPRQTCAGRSQAEVRERMRGSLQGQFWFEGWARRIGTAKSRRRMRGSPQECQGKSCGNHSSGHRVSLLLSFVPCSQTRFATSVALNARLKAPIGAANIRQKNRFRSTSYIGDANHLILWP